MFDPNPTPPYDRLLRLIRGLRDASADLSERYSTAVQQCERQVAQSALRLREDRTAIESQHQRTLEELKHEHRINIRNLTDKRKATLHKLEGQKDSVERRIDRFADSKKREAFIRAEKEEWMREGLYEGKVDHALKVLREARAQLEEVDELADALNAIMPRAGAGPTKPNESQASDLVDLKSILAQLRHMEKIYGPPKHLWITPWRLLTRPISNRRRVSRDRPRLEALRTQAIEIFDTIQASHDAVISKAESTRNREKAGVDATMQPTLKQFEPSLKKFHDRLESTYEDKLATATGRFDVGQTRLEDQYESDSLNLEQQQRMALEHLNAQVVAETEAATSTFDETKDWLAEEWTDAQARLTQDARTLITLRESSPLDWHSDFWSTWQPGQASQTIAAVADLQLDIAHILEPLTNATPFTWDGPASATLPIMLSLPTNASTIIEFEPESRAAAIGAARSVVLRLLCATPPGKARLTLFDPVGLGESFAGFMHLADVDEGKMLDRVYSEAKHIDEQLLQLTGHMEDVIQTYLRNEYETIDDYNRHAGEIAEPYRFLVMADFPDNLTEQATKRLLSILRSGARCGVYAILLRDRRRPLPQDMHESDLHDGMIVIRSEGGAWNLQTNGLDPMPITLSGDMVDSQATAMLHRLRDASEATHRVEVPFRVVTPSDDKLWTGSTTNEIRVALGQSGANRQQYLRLGRGTAQHALVAGKTGSGKSTLMHVLITNLALWHSPDEVQFYLVDFKKGVEFQVYVNYHLPHAKVIAIESDREFGLSVLQHIDQELKRRGELYRTLGVQDLAGFRKASTEPLPRVLLIVDEFQELFIEDDQVTQEASLLLDRLVRQGRAFGMHALLGSQTLDGVYSLARSTMGQMGVRIALQCSETDSYLILSEENPAARLLDRPGDAIYNDAGGRLEGNSHFQVVWMSEAERDKSLMAIQARAKQEGVDREPFVFRGHVAAELAGCEPLNKRLAGPIETRDAIDLWLGDAVAIQPPTFLTIHRRSGANLLVLGQSEEPAAALIEAMMLAIATQATPQERPTFVIFDGLSTGEGRLERFGQALPHVVRTVTEPDLNETMTWLHAQLGRRSEDARAPHPPMFLIFAGLQTWRGLRRNEDDFSFSADEGPPKPDAIFAALLRDGPTVGMHVIAWIDTVNNMTRFVDRTSQREFENRVLFQMSQMDSSQVIDSTVAGRLGPNRALVHSEEQGRIEKFRPWGLSDESWWIAQASSLQQ